MQRFKLIAGALIMVGALLTSAHAAYMILTTQLNTGVFLAILAAVVIDLAAIWLGTHAADLAELGDSVIQVNLYSAFVMTLSLAINFMYGFVQGTWITGLLSCIYPVIAMIVYERWIQHKIRASKRRRGLVLPEKSVYLKGKYQDKKAVKELKKYEAKLSLEAAQRHVTSKYTKLHNDTEFVFVPCTTGESVQSEIVHSTEDYIPVQQGEIVQLQEVQPVVQNTLHVQDQIESVFASVQEDSTEIVQLPDWLSTEMNTPSIVYNCLARGITEFSTIEQYVNTINTGEVSPNTIRTNITRQKQKLAKELSSRPNA